MMRARRSVQIARLVTAAALCLAGAQVSASEMPEGFVYLRDIDPTILQDMRYAGPGNFTGARVPGYDAGECVLVRQAAEALKAVQADVRARGLTLKVYDCYRPARAVASFVDWAKEPDDPAAKTTYYPNLPKAALFPDYIATRSGHSRGATVDLTLVPIAPESKPPAKAEGDAPLSCTAPQQGRARDGSLAMGTSFDCFDVKANTAAPGLSQEEAGQPRYLGRRHAGARLQELSARMVALYARARALSRHDLRLSDRAAALNSTLPLMGRAARPKAEPGGVRIFQRANASPLIE